MEQVGYVPNLSARAMKTGRSGLIGVVVADLTNPFYPQLLEALSQTFDATGLRLTVWVAEGTKNGAALQAIQERAVDGVVFTTVTDSSAELRSALDRQSPVVLVNRFLPGLACDQVGSDNVAGATLVADHMLAHGRRRIAFIGGGTAFTTTRDRLAGFEERLRRAGRALTGVVQGEYTHRSGRDSMLRLLQEGERPDAVFCSNDLLAFGALDAIRAHGLRVPEDVWVVGYDDVQMSAWDSFSLTTVRQDVGALASSAAGLLLRRMDDPASPPRRVLLAPELVVRRSTALSRQC